MSLIDRLAAAHQAEHPPANEPPILQLVRVLKAEGKPAGMATVLAYLKEQKELLDGLRAEAHKRYATAADDLDDVETERLKAAALYERAQAIAARNT